MAWQGWWILVGLGLGLYSPVQAEKLRVLVTVAPLFEFTQGITGDRATVDLLIQPGIDIHDYQARPQDIQRLRKADLLIKNGLGLEGFLPKLIVNSNNPKLRVLDSSRGVVTLPSQTVGEYRVNPHIWLDPVRVQQQILTIRDGLIQTDPVNRASYTYNTQKLIQKLQVLDQDYRQGLAPFKQRAFLTFHDAFSYLAQRYQLQQILPVSIQGPLRPQDYQRTINAVRTYKITTLLRSSKAQNQWLQTLSQDLGLNVKTLDTLEWGPSGQYFPTMRRNLQALKAALTP